MSHYASPQTVQAGQSSTRIHVMIETVQTRLESLRSIAEHTERIAAALLGCEPQETKTPGSAPVPVAAPGTIGTIEYLIETELRDVLQRLDRAVSRLHEIA